MRAFGIALISFLAVSFGSATARAATEIKFATLAPKGSAWAKAVEKTGKAIETRTEGRVKMKFFFGGTQGDERDFIRKMKLGQIDGAGVTAVGLAVIRQDVKLIELPFLFRDIKEVDYVRPKMFPIYEKDFEKEGFVVLAWAETGWVRFYHAVPLDSKGSLANLKMWAWTDDATMRALIKRMGINGVPLGVPDVLPSLQTGLINGCYGSAQVAVAFQWYTKAKYASDVGIVFSTAGLIVRKEVLDKLSAADQQVIREEGKALGEELTRSNRRDEARARKAMERAGVQFVKYPPELMAEFEKQGRQVWEDLAGKVYSREMLEKVKKHIAEVRR